MTANLAAYPDRSAAVAETVLDDGTPALRVHTAAQPSDAIRDRVTALDGTVDTTGAGCQLTIPVEG